METVEGSWDDNLDLTNPVLDEIATYRRFENPERKWGNDYLTPQESATFRKFLEDQPEILVTNCLRIHMSTQYHNHPHDVVLHGNTPDNSLNQSVACLGMGLVTTIPIKRRRYMLALETCLSFPGSTKSLWSDTPITPVTLSPSQLLLLHQVAQDIGRKMVNDLGTISYKISQALNPGRHKKFPWNMDFSVYLPLGSEGVLDLAQTKVVMRLGQTSFYWKKVSLTHPEHSLGALLLAS